VRAAVAEGLEGAEVLVVDAEAEIGIVEVEQPWMRARRLASLYRKKAAMAR